MSGKETNTLVHRFLHWEQVQPDAIYLTEPTADGQVIDYTWRQVGDEARRIAAWLQSQDLPPRSAVSIVGKNTAHWIIADLAIWFAGHVSVPLYPTIGAETARFIVDYCDVRVMFVGKLDGNTDGFNEIRQALPSHVELVGLPQSPAMPDAQHDVNERVVRMAVRNHIVIRTIGPHAHAPDGEDAGRERRVP